MNVTVAPHPTITLLQTSSLTSVVQSELERMILSGELEPGAKLTEMALAARLGVSRGPLREAFRMLGQLDSAVPHLERALTLARELDKPKFVVSNLIRLATAYQYLNRHSEAEPLFLEAIALAQRIGVLEDFALQHHGKSLAEQGRWLEAVARFEQALALRRAKGSAELVASSEDALEAAQAHLG